jgi:hypothetical protein
MDCVVPKAVSSNAEPGRSSPASGGRNAVDRLYRRSRVVAKKLRPAAPTELLKLVRTLVESFYADLRRGHFAVNKCSSSAGSRRASPPSKSGWPRIAALLSLDAERGRSPYEGLPMSRFWKTGVCEQSPRTVEGLYTKRFMIDREARIAAAGSCFAQHISKRLRDAGYNVIDVERPPAEMSPDLANRFGYGLYSARYGNIYHARQLLQLAQQAYGMLKPVDDIWIWTKGGRFFDAFRPGVEPRGLDSRAEVRRHRKYHLARVARLFKSMDLFIFTLGLTEAWVHRESGTVFPTAPGVIAGTYDPKSHEFKNFSFNEIYADLVSFRELILSKNPNTKFLLTVSPVPLTATASNEHVLCATTHSKSVLRAVAGELSSTFPDVDYFPSYEIIASPWSRGSFYRPNLRNVDESGVDAVMRCFFSEHASGKPLPRKGKVAARVADEGEAVCEEALLQEFGE